MLKLQKLILENKNWKSVLSSPPYSIDIKEEKKYIILKYNMLDSDPTQDYVKEARGIIFRSTDLTPVCIPFFRFYNYNESYADKINWDTIRVQEKIDGSIIKVWHDDIWHVSTNGTIDAFQTVINPELYGDESFGSLTMKAFNIQNEKIYLDIKNNTFNILNKNYTYMFELVSPQTRIVIPYQNIKIFHTGARNNNTLIEEKFDLGIDRPKEYVFKTFEDCCKYASELPFSEEGYVAVDDNWKRIKIKGLAYLKAHHLKNNGVITLNRVAWMILHGENNEFLGYYPEYVEIFEKVKMKYKIFIIKLIHDFKLFIEKKHLGRKEFALSILKESYFSNFLFLMYSGRIRTIDEFLSLNGDEVIKYL
jgi:hypothetical protein